VAKSQWNVRYGWDLLSHYAPRYYDYVAITSPSAWAVVEGSFPIPPRHVEYQKGMGEQYLDSLLERLPDADYVLAIGGGNALDVGKFVAWRREKPLVLIPTIVSSGAVYQPYIAIRRSSGLEFHITVAPEVLLFDYGAIRAAPPHLNCAGMGECICQLGVVAGWKWWDEQGLDGRAYDQAMADGTLAWVRERSAQFSADLDENGQPGETGIRILAEINQQRHEVPTAQGVERRSVDHTFVVSFELLQGRELIHSEGVALGTLISNHVYEHLFDECKSLLEACRVRYRPRDLGCTEEEVRYVVDRINERYGSGGNWFQHHQFDDDAFTRMMDRINE
jgi:hypothetical protein